MKEDASAVLCWLSIGFTIIVGSVMFWVESTHQKENTEFFQGLKMVQLGMEKSDVDSLLLYNQTRLYSRIDEDQKLEDVIYRSSPSRATSRYVYTQFLNGELVWYSCWKNRAEQIEVGCKETLDCNYKK